MMRSLRPKNSINYAITFPSSEGLGV
ncbi:hypothetical protein SAMN05216269_109112, partial [Flavobacterium xinjiangense]